MKISRFRAAATCAALATGAAVVVTGASPALAAGGTGSQLFTCTNYTSADANDHAGPIKVAVTTDSSLPASASPSGQSVALTGTVALTIPTEVIAGLKVQGGATKLGITGSRVHLHVTNATPSDLIVDVGTAARTNLPASGPMTFTFPGVSLGTVTTAGSAGGTVAVSIDASQAANDGFGLNPDGAAAGIPGAANFGFLQTGGNTAPNGNCIADADATLNGAGGAALADFTTADNAPAIGSFDLIGQPPTITSLPASYNAIAGQSSDVSVTATDADGTLSGVTWAAGSPSCDAGTGAAASISGTGGSATLHFTAPNANATCTVSVTATDHSGNQLVTDHSSKTATFHVLAGSGASQSASDYVASGDLTLSACGKTNTPQDSSQINPASCYVQFTPAQLNGSDLTTYGFITGSHAPAPLAAGFSQAVATLGSQGWTPVSDNEITVADNRGQPATWNLTAQLDGDLANANPSLTGPHAKIDSSNLMIQEFCTPDAGNTNTVTTHAPGPLTAGVAPLSLCSAAAGQNSGSTYLDASLALSIPQTTYAGLYTGTIDFIVS
jgi:hypothetical protein